MGEQAVLFMTSKSLFPRALSEAFQRLFQELDALEIPYYFWQDETVLDLVLPRQRVLNQEVLKQKDSTVFLCVGCSPDDYAFCKAAGYPFILAHWGGETRLPAKWHLLEPSDLLLYLKDYRLTEPWLSWAMELQSMAQCGLAYSPNPFDKDRYERLRELSFEMLAYQGKLPTPKVRDLFGSDTGYQTPKIDTRAAIFQDEKILLVQEHNGRWTLPGGWLDVLESVKSNTEKEAMEEAGAKVEARRLIAVVDRRKSNPKPYAYAIIKCFVLCDLLSFHFKANTETQRAAFFALDELPPLFEAKTSKAQIEWCFEAKRNPDCPVLFD